MERKTIGSFIAVLRKANGLTQKELAEKLNVSDKAVSRWERDECAPDLTLIPVIAEIFDVTADELLCGERKAVQITEGTDKLAPRVEKQLRRYLDTTMAKLRNLFLIPIILSACTVLTAVIVPSVYAAIAIGTILSVIAIISGIVFLYNAHLSTVSEDFDEEKLNAFKKKTIDLSKIPFSLSFYSIYFLFALNSYLSFCSGSNGDTYEQMRELFTSPVHNIFSFDCIFIFCLYALFAYVLFRTVWAIVIAVLTKRGTYPVDKAQKATVKKQRIFFIVASLIISCTIFAEANAFVIGNHFIEGLKFNDEKSFVEFMGKSEADITENVAGLYGTTLEAISDNEEDEGLTDTLAYEDGKTTEFTWRNKSVVEWLTSKGTTFPITVYTKDLYVRDTVVYRTICTAILSAEFVATFVVYIMLFKRRKKRLNK